MGARAQPLHARIGRREAARGAAERRIERGADDRQRVGSRAVEPAPRGEARSPDPFPRADGRPARNAGAQDACAATARACAPTGTRRAPCRAVRAGTCRGASSCSTTSRSASASDACASGIARRQIAIEIGAGECDDQRAVGMRARHAAMAPMAAPGVQRDHGDRVVAAAAARSARRPLVQSRGTAARAGAPSARRCASCRCSRRRGTA